MKHIKKYSQMFENYIDTLLDKISTSGIKSLSKSEREYLCNVSKGNKFNSKEFDINITSIEDLRDTLFISASIKFNKELYVGTITFDKEKDKFKYDFSGKFGELILSNRQEQEFEKLIMDIILTNAT